MSAAPERTDTTTEKLTSRTDHVEEKAEGAQGDPEDAQRPADVVKRVGRPFTKESAQAALAARRLKEAARHAEADRERTLSHLTSRQRIGLGLAKLTQDRIDRIIDRLATEAEAGDTKAIHALARLLDQSFGRSGEEKLADDRPFVDKTFDEMTPQERSLYRQELLKQIRENESAAGDSSDPRSEQ